MKIKKAKTRMTVSLTYKEYEKLVEVVGYCDTTLTDRRPEGKDLWNDLVIFCRRFEAAAANPVANLRGKK